MGPCRTSSSELNGSKEGDFKLKFISDVTITISDVTNFSTPNFATSMNNQNVSNSL